MKIFIAGASGLVGSHLVPFLRKEGHEVIRLVRRPFVKATDEISWDPEVGNVPIETLEGCDAIINLAGDNLADGKWTDAKKEKMRKSRLETTRTLATAIRDLRKPPAIFLNASAVGYYGANDERVIDEDSPQGMGYAASLCGDWEKAADEEKTNSVRVIFLRMGTVLTADGGMLGRILPYFRLGLGGSLGHGRQPFSWISMEDLLRAILFLIENKSIDGPVNLVAPHPVTNREFTSTLGSVLHRPTILSIPKWLIHCCFGEMGDELLLRGSFVMPKRLIDGGFFFRYPDLDEALLSMLSK